MVDSRKLARFKSLIAGADPERIEGARDLVRREDLPALADLYWTLENWAQKGALVNLIQDYIETTTQAVMRDYLQAPPDERGDEIELNKAIALCHLQGDFGLFDEYCQNRAKIAGDAQRYFLEKRR